MKIFEEGEYFAVEEKEDREVKGGKYFLAVQKKNGEGTIPLVICAELTNPREEFWYIIGKD